MQVLVCLAAQAGQVVPKERLMRTVWPDTFVGDDVLTRAISELRRVFGDDVRNPRFIQTIPKSGYRLMAPVSFTSPDDIGAAMAKAVGTETRQSRRRRRRCEHRDRPCGRPSSSAAAPLEARPGDSGGRRRRSAGRRRRPADDDVARCQSRPLGPAHLYRAGRLSIARGGLVPGARHRRRARLLHADDRERADARTVLSGRRRGRPHPNAAESAVPRERVAGRVAAAGPRIGACATRKAPSGWFPPWAAHRFASVRSWPTTAPGRPTANVSSLPAARSCTWPAATGANRESSRRRPAVRPGCAGPRTARACDSRSSVRRGTRGRSGKSRPRGTACGRCRWAAASTTWTAAASGVRTGGISSSAGSVTTGSDIWAIQERRGLFGGRATGPARVTSGPLYFTAPVPTRDGRRLLVIGGQPRGENLRFDLGRREFAPYNAGGSAGWFAFSRDGEWMAYVQYPEGILWRSRVDGSERRQLTQPPLRVLLPRWSPDGTRIAFMGRIPGQLWKIYAIAAEGGEPQPILEGDRPEADPDWAPDGKSLMFGRPPDYLAEPAAPKAIHLLDLRTRELSTLPDSNGLFGSRWSPSGRYVAAVTLDQQTLRPLRLQYPDVDGAGTVQDRAQPRLVARRAVSVLRGC